MAKRKTAKSSSQDKDKIQEETTKEQTRVEEDEEEDVEQSFTELGLDPRLVCALSKKNIDKPTPIQRVAILLIVVYLEVMSLIELCRAQLSVAQLTSNMFNSDLRTALAGPPDILVATPACIQICLSNDILQPKDVQDSLSIIVLDEADLLLSYGYEDDLKALTTHVPRRCQCLLMSATSSSVLLTRNSNFN